MKALIFNKTESIFNNPLYISDYPLPDITADEILMKVKTCGVCHTDLHIIEGDIPLKKFPVVVGHQAIGEVIDIGQNVKRFKIGDRVGVPWLYSTCGKCKYCLGGNENLCDEENFTGYHADGGFAEYLKIRSEYAYLIPENFSYENAAPLMCAGIIGYRALKISGIKPFEKLGLYGFGASAHLTIQVARYWGCKVYVFSRSSEHRKLAEKLGAVWTGTPDQNTPERLDAAISFAPTGEIVPFALKNLDKGGILALAGIYTTPIPKFDYSLIYHERVIRSVANSTRNDANEFLKLAGKIPVKTEVEVFPFEEANRALQLLKQGKINGAAVLKIL